MCNSGSSWGREWGLWGCWGAGEKAEINRCGEREGEGGKLAARKGGSSALQR